MANDITLNGYNSQLDIKGIVSSLVAAEKAPKEAQLKRLESDTTAKFTGIGQLKSAISDLQTILKELNKPEMFQKRSASTSDEKFVTATATKDALPGIYKFEVTQLASVSKVATASFGDAFKTSTGGTLTIKQGPDDAGVTVNVAAGATLEEVRDSLNAQLKDKGISANIVNNPGDGTSRLVFTGKDSGAGKDVFVQGSSGLENFNIGSVGADGKLTLSQLDGTSPSSSGYITQARNAEFSIDGLVIQSPTNTVDKVIKGVTFELKTVTDKDKPVTISVEQDRSGVKDNIKKFVEAYNKLVGVTSELTGVTKVGDDKAPVVGALVGDSSVRNLLTTMRNEMVQPGQGTDVRMLADMGITTKKDGTLEIDDKKLDKVLKDKFESVSALFTGDTGLMKRLDDKLTPYTQTGGVLQQRLDGLQDTIKSVDTQREALNRRVEQLQERLLKQFTAMDQLIGQLNQTSGRMAQALGSLPGVVKN
ncbi:flagellar filament capping protein FliD [Pseudomonas paraeruginosa]|uniref:Flagellar hook-associated protein 2 n=1 Tax=Pseudomonas aeruginosa TaxID=287 RepID=A0ABD7K7U4_PSEAI|nr:MULTISPECIES: flagellar filament capping protein FliD [Pseudomonas aeruginosa group]KFF33906.1 A-type flagellar hook-associated protein 2 [Pseudomonas aeruginosa VRFPA01]RTR99746.1 A-type flagellar hook-associated protein 2 [Pseudomonas paraeruginosa]RTS50507.1 A-type flagellar hook-associated protein 2 [Pseudomonas aeruginosa]